MKISTLMIAGLISLASPVMAQDPSLLDQILPPIQADDGAPGSLPLEPDFSLVDPTQLRAVEAPAAAGMSLAGELGAAKVMSFSQQGNVTPDYLFQPLLPVLPLLEFYGYN